MYLLDTAAQWICVVKKNIETHAFSIYGEYLIIY